MTATPSDVWYKCSACGQVLQGDPDPYARFQLLPTGLMHVVNNVHFRGAGEFAMGLCGPLTIIEGPTDEPYPPMDAPASELEVDDQDDSDDI